MANDNGVHRGENTVLAAPPPGGGPGFKEVVADAACGARALEHARTQLDPFKVHVPPGNPEPTLEAIQPNLLPSWTEHGQLVDIIVYPHPALPGEYEAADGNHRVLCARLRATLIWARVLPKAPTGEELITLRVNIALAQKKVDKFSLGADVRAWREMTGATQAAAAVNFGISQGYVSKLERPYENGIPALVRALKDRLIAPTTAAMIAALPGELQEQALPRVLGQKRFAAEGVIAELCPRPERGRKDKALKVVLGAVTAVINTRDWEKALAEAQLLVAGLRRAVKQKTPADKLLSCFPAAAS